MDGLLADTPALARLRWLLAGLDDRWSPAADVAAALTPQFAHAVTPAAVLAVTRERAQRLAPIRVVGVDTGSQAATARFLSRDDEPWVAHVEVAGAAPHRITTMYAQPAVPDHLTPSLPLDFTGLPMPSTPDRRSSSSAAYQAAARARWPKASVPPSGSRPSPSTGCSGALTPFGMRHREDLMSVGEERLTTLAYRELHAGRSAILDTPGEDPRTRARWASLARAAGARFVPVVCVCSDQVLHRRRTEDRVRGIPGWADPGDWPDVRRRLSAFPPWPGALTIDTVDPLHQCVSSVVQAVRADTGEGT